MNYFTHGFRFLDQPEFLAGTAVPDWLSVADRRCRVRPKLVRPVLENGDRDEAAIARGILQHFHDDEWFHSTRAFVLASAGLTRRFQQAFPDDDGMRTGFLGHIVTEMLLDAVLIGREPELLDEYYRRLEDVDPERVQRVVNRAARNTTDRLSGVIQMFREVRFLYDYLEFPLLLGRLNQVLRRVKLQPLSDRALPVLESGLELVTGSLDELLPPHRFGPQQSDSLLHEHEQADSARSSAGAERPRRRERQP
ncbi:MAG: hypothetical protein DWQ29_22275 [Planctomycetota bacterium]|nr:MAG: hypothetical protein DWQ29_22275 [Planctomycetota bacterium]